MYVCTLPFDDVEIGGWNRSRQFSSVRYTVQREVIRDAGARRVWSQVRRGFCRRSPPTEWYRCWTCSRWRRRAASHGELSCWRRWSPSAASCWPTSTTSRPSSPCQYHHHVSSCLSLCRPCHSDRPPARTTSLLSPKNATVPNSRT